VRYIMRYKARVHMWWSVTDMVGRVMNWAYNTCGQWWYKVNWYQSPLGRVVFAIRCWDGMVRTNEYLKQQADDYLRAGNELRDDKELLREALLIATEDESVAVAQGALEALLQQAEANIAKREYATVWDEPF